MNFMRLFPLIAVVIASLLGVALFMDKGPKPLPAASKDLAYQRVLQAGVLRCGYSPRPLFLERNETNGAFGGLYYELMQEIGRQLGVRVEWSEKVDGASAPGALSSGRIDAVCSLLTFDPGTVEYTAPFFYIPYYAYARALEERFHNNLAQINDPAVSVAFLDGRMGRVIKDQAFPRATAVPVSDGPMSAFREVAASRADVALAEASDAAVFLQRDPNRLRQIEGPPVRVQAVTIVVGSKEKAFKDLLTGAIFTLQNKGFSQQLLERYLGAAGETYFLPTTLAKIEEKKK